ncbi:MAG: FAD:protein FMN transferase, partial [Muribaculaceae bacterium]|nr:FAD:protein FMN transferase [Muribaculaceae bacterium]
MKHNRQLKHLTYAILAIPTLWITGCNTSPTFNVVQGAVWNTTYNIKYSGERNLDDSIMTVINNIELSLSPFNHNSLIARINDNISMKADSNIIKVMEISQTVNHLSDKAFDPTVSPLVHLWGFGYEGHEAKDPTDNDIASALALVRIASCH